MRPRHAGKASVSVLPLLSPPCTPDPRFWRFSPICRNEESITYDGSSGGRETIPTAPTKTILLVDNRLRNIDGYSEKKMLRRDLWYVAEQLENVTMLAGLSPADVPTARIVRSI